MYAGDIQPGTKIYAITNRLLDSSATHLQFTKHLTPESTLTFVRATFLGSDSLVAIKLDSTDFLKEISAYDNDWLLFVHGDGKSFKEAIQRGLDIQYLYNVNVIVFSWPSLDPVLNGLENVKKSQQNVIESVESFYHALQFMDTFRQSNPSFSDGKNLSLFAHSLGNYYMKNLVTQNFIYKFRICIFDNLILNEAAVNEKDHKKWVEQLDIQDRIYITSNNKDFTLRGFQIFTDEGKQLGENAELPIASNAVYIHFTDVVGFRFPVGSTHTYFIGEEADKNKNIQWFYQEVMHGMELNLLNTKVFKERTDGLGYNIQPNTD